MNNNINENENTPRTVTTYVNQENMEKAPKVRKKLTVASLAGKSGLAGILTTLATNKTFIFAGNIGEDKIIEFLTTQMNRFQWGADGATKSEFIAQLFKVVRTGVEVSWASVMANPLASAATIGAIVAAGGAVMGLARKIKRNHDVKTGEVVETDRKGRLK